MSQADDERAIRAQQAAWAKAWADQDLAAMGRILAPDFQLIMSSSPDRPISRRALIMALSQYKVQGFAFEGVHVRLFGDFALVSGIGTPIGASENLGAEQRKPHFLVEAWRRHPEGWLIEARYSALPAPFVRIGAP